MLSIFKEIIPTQIVHTGINLQTRLMSIEQAYDSFCAQIEDSLRRATSFLLEPLAEDKWLIFDGLQVSLSKLNLAFVCESLAFKLVAEMFIAEQGIMGALRAMEAVSPATE